MGLIRVEVAGRKIEIDVCEKCLSVWCDQGEFEALVPERKQESGKPSFHDLAKRASPEAVDPSDIDMEDVVLDLVRLIVGAPTLWRTVKPVTPIFAILLTLAIPIAHACAYYAWHVQEYVRMGCRHRSFWVMDEAMMKAGGLELSAHLTSLMSFPFLQTDGTVSLLLAFLLFPVFTIVERKAGHLRFLFALVICWATAIVAHVVQIAWDLQPEAWLCGIAPIALGFTAYMQSAYPHLRWQWRKDCDIGSAYLVVVTMVLLIDRVFCMARLSAYAFGLLSLVSCSVVGWRLGKRRNSLRHP